MFQSTMMPNPGSQGGAAAAAFAGRVIGGLPGLVWAYAQTKDQLEGQKKVGAGPAFLRFLGQVGGAAGGAAMAAPEPLRTRAAIGAAIGGAIPIIGAPLAALGAYMATSPKRSNNPEPVTTAVLVGLGLLAAGGATYMGVKAYRSYKAKQGELPSGDAGAKNVDEWGVDLDTNEQWGVGPITGQDGQDYAYVIYFNRVDGTYWYMYRGASGSGSSGPFATSAEAEWCIDNALPSPCVGRT